MAGGPAGQVALLASGLALMKSCPKCKKEMQEWIGDISQDDMPTVVDLIGYGCHHCKLTFIDLNKSNFDGFFYKQQNIINSIMKQAIDVEEIIKE